VSRICSFLQPLSSFLSLSPPRGLGGCLPLLHLGRATFPNSFPLVGGHRSCFTCRPLPPPRRFSRTKSAPFPSIVPFPREMPRDFLKSISRNPTHRLRPLSFFRPRFAAHNIFQFSPPTFRKCSLTPSLEFAESSAFSFFLLLWS